MEGWCPVSPCDQQPVRVEGRQDQILRLNQSVDVDQRHDEAGVAATRVPANSLQVGFDGNIRSVRRLKLHELVPTTKRVL